MRNRQNYQSDILLVTDPSDSAFAQSSEIVILNRIQSASFGFTIAQKNVNQFGKFGKVGSQAISAPQVSATFSYLLSFEDNEEKLGFHVSADPLASFTKNFLSTRSSNPYADSVKYGKNFFILTGEEGLDANNVDDGLAEGKNVSVLTVGGGYINSYSAQASVGSIPQVSFSIVGSQLQVEPNTVPLDKDIDPNLTVSNPFVHENSGANADNLIDVSELGDIDGRSSTTSAVRPGDLCMLAVRRDGSVISSSEDTHDFLSTHIQSFSLQIPLNRTPTRKLGKLYNFSQEVDFPIEVSLSFSALVSDANEESVFDEIFNNLGDLDFWILFKSEDKAIRLFDEEGNPLLTELGENLFTEGDAEIIAGNPSSIEGAVGYVIRGCELVGKSYSAQIGSNKTVDVSYSAQVGGSNDIRNGIAFINS